MIVSCWECPIETELQHCNSIGCRLSKSNIGPHFSGNFWWSKSEYIKNLKEVGTNYFDAENWILSSEGLIYNRNTKTYTINSKIVTLGVNQTTCYAFVIHVLSYSDYMLLYNDTLFPSSKRHFMKIRLFRKACLKK